MPSLTYSDQYMMATVALSVGMTIGEFEMLPWDEQARHIAFDMAKRKIEDRYIAAHNEKMRQMAKGSS